jgi:hypothetical protein
MFPSGGGYAYLKINKEHSDKSQFVSKMVDYDCHMDRESSAEKNRLTS